VAEYTTAFFFITFAGGDGFLLAQERQGGGVLQNAKFVKPFKLIWVVQSSLQK